MKVALVNDWFLRYASEQAIGLTNAGADVAVVCRDHFQEFNGDHAEWQSRIDAMRDAGVETIVVRGRTRSVTAMRSGIAAARRLRAWHPDVVHAHPSTDPWLHLVTLGLPLVLTLHDPIPHEGQTRLGRIAPALSDAWNLRTDAFIIHGEALRPLTAGTAGRRPIWVVPHGLTPSPLPYPLPSERRVLFFGRLEPYKGVDVLIRAMDQVRERCPDTELVIAGQGPAAKHVPDHPQIRLLDGYIPEDDVDGLLASATLVVAPYTEASQSGVVSLAVARGIPTVVTDQGALPDLAVDAGLVVPAGDATALAQALVTYLDHDEDLRRRVHAFGRDQLSWEAVGRRALDLYPQLGRRR